MVTVKDVAKKAGVSTATVSRVLNNSDRLKDETRKKVLEVIDELNYQKNSSNSKKVNINNNQVTLNDVAKLAGVSKSTASRVLNNNQIVSPETKRKVKKAMEALNYSPNMNARNLKSDETKLVGVIIPDISNPIFGEVVDAIENTADLYNYNVVLFNTAFDYNKMEKAFQILKSRRADGLIYITGEFNPKEKELLENFETPIVQLFRDPEENERNFPTVNIDNYKAASEMTKFLIDSGYKEIGFISGTLIDKSPLKRLKAFKQTLKDNNLSYINDWIVEGHYTLESGYQAMTKILNNKELPRAVFVANDEMAIGAIQAIKDNNLNVPEDIAIVGFDNIRFSKYISPKLTTISQPIYQFGEKGMQMLVKLMNGESLEEENIFLDYELVIRQST